MFIFPGRNDLIKSVHMAEPSAKNIQEDDLLDNYGAIDCIYRCPLLVIDLYNQNQKINIANVSNI